jgi:hypothetical protein
VDARRDGDEEVGWRYLKLILAMEGYSATLPVASGSGWNKSGRLWSYDRENVQTELASAAIALACIEMLLANESHGTNEKSGASSTVIGTTISIVKLFQQYLTTSSQVASYSNLHASQFHRHSN